jgi:hypothetical protein
MIDKFKIAAFIAFIFYSGSAFCQSLSISGYVTDSKTRETLIGATVVLKPSTYVTVTDNYGFYSLSGLKPGTYSLIVSHLGYKTFEKEVILSLKGIILQEINLIPAPLKLDEVSIIALKPDQAADREVEIGQKVLSPQLIESIPTARNDIFSAIKFLPGIDRTEPFSPLYTTRGGDPGENAVLLDGVMIYNPYHSSITSGIFNTQTIKNVDLLVGGFGAEYGGRNSSVMYITTKDGNPNEFHGEIEPSTFHSKLFLEFPAGKDASMLIAGRYLYDVPYNFLFNNTNYFYDYNISYTKRINNRNRITLKYFESKDFTGYNFNTFYRYLGNSFNTDLYDDFTLEQRNYWENRAATVIHKLIISPRIYLRNQVYYSAHQSNNYSGLDFDLKFPNENKDTMQLKWASNSSIGSAISDLSAKTTMNIRTASYNEIKIGAEYNAYSFKNSISVNDVDNGSFNRQPTLLSVFIEDKISNTIFTLRPGLRFTQYRNNQWRYEPRINLLVNVSKRFKIKAAYGEYIQYIISMNTNEIEMSQIVDYYYPIWDRAPSKSIHYILGTEQRLSSTLNLTIDAYYKSIVNTYTFDLNQEQIEQYKFTDKLQEGSGKAYGLEFYLHGRFKKVSGWISYSLAYATRKYPNSNINDGNEFPFDYNRRHTFKSVINYQITPNFAFNTSLLVLSGIKRSIETTTQSFYAYNPSSDEMNYFPLYASSEKNVAQMPPQINLDFSIRKKLVNGFGKQLANFLKADESYVSISIRNILFLYRNIDYYYPGTFISTYYDKYIPIGSNYLPRVGISYTLKF